MTTQRRRRAWEPGLLQNCDLLPGCLIKIRCQALPKCLAPLCRLTLRASKTLTFCASRLQDVSRTEEIDAWLLARPLPHGSTPLTAGLAEPSAEKSVVYVPAGVAPQPTVAPVNQRIQYALGQGLPGPFGLAKKHPALTPIQPHHVQGCASPFDNLMVLTYNFTIAKT